MSDLRVLRSSVQGATGLIRREMRHGREHIVVPVVALMQGVIHAVNAPTAEFVPRSAIATAPHTWNGRPVVLGHPMRDGRQCSANDPTILESHAFGEVFQSHMDGNKLCMEAWIDPERVKKIGAEKMLERILEGDVIEVSVGAFVTTKNNEGHYEGRDYEAEWVDVMPDHLAFLPESVGACSVAMGCGAVRAAEAAEPEALIGNGNNQYTQNNPLTNDSAKHVNSALSSKKTVLQRFTSPAASNAHYQAVKNSLSKAGWLKGDDSKFFGGSNAVKFHKGDQYIMVTRGQAGASPEGKYSVAVFLPQKWTGPSQGALPKGLEAALESDAGLSEQELAEFVALIGNGNNQYTQDNPTQDASEGSKEGTGSASSDLERPGQGQGRLGKDNEVVWSGKGTDKFAKDYMAGVKGDYRPNGATRADDKASEKFGNEYKYAGGRSGFAGSGVDIFEHKESGALFRVDKNANGKGFYGTTHSISRTDSRKAEEAIAEPETLIGNGNNQYTMNNPSQDKGSIAAKHPSLMRDRRGSEPGTKDQVRIRDIVRKSGGDPAKQEQLAHQMANSINKADKAMRRGYAASDQGHQNIARIFLRRADVLMGNSSKSGKSWGSSHAEKKLAFAEGKMGLSDLKMKLDLDTSPFRARLAELFGSLLEGVKAIAGNDEPETLIGNGNNQYTQGGGAGDKSGGDGAKLGKHESIVASKTVDADGKKYEQIEVHSKWAIGIGSKRSPELLAKKAALTKKGWLAEHASKGGDKLTVFKSPYGVHGAKAMAEFKSAEGELDLKTAEEEDDLFAGMVSLDDRLEAVRQAVYQKYSQSGGGPTKTTVGSAYPQKIYDDCVILREGEKYFMVGYEVDDEGKILLEDTKDEVKLSYVAAEGRRNSTADQTMIQTMHDHSVQLGATCHAGNVKALETAEKPAEPGDTPPAQEEEKKEEKVAEPVAEVVETKVADVAADVKAAEAAREEQGTVAEAAPAEPGVADSAPVIRAAECGCEEKKPMTNEQKTEMIRALTECKYSGFTAADQAMLEAASDERLEAFKVAADARKQESDNLKTAAAKPMTEEDFMKVAPASLKSLIARQQKQETEHKTELVTALKTAQEEYSEAELAAMSIESLERLARVAKIEATPNFAGRGLPRFAAGKENDVYANPPDPYAEALKRQQGKVN